MKIVTECEDDGRWIAEVAILFGVLAYGRTEDEAVAKAKALALRVIAERFENGEPLPVEVGQIFEAA
jgi:predicted RNase H-like HicB family nuclease